MVAAGATVPHCVFQRPGIVATLGRWWKSTDIERHPHMTQRIGIFGWGVVAPKSPDVETFEDNLKRATTWLEPFDGFGPSNFLVGRPDFDFETYRSWIEARFEPRRFSQLQDKMGNTVKYAIGAFIQALLQNPGIEDVLRELRVQTHVYVGTGLGDFPLQYELVQHYRRAQLQWNRFWCQYAHNTELAEYQRSDDRKKGATRERLSAPPDPETIDQWSDEHDEAARAARRIDWGGAQSPASRRHPPRL